MIRKVIDMTYRTAKRIVVIAVGSTILAIGIVMIVFPGPAIIAIPVGLAILGIEFAWARRWLRRIRERISSNNAGSRAERAEAHRNRAEP